MASSVMPAAYPAAADAPGIKIETTTNAIHFMASAYTASVAADGTLTSFSIGGQEFFKSAQGLPRGAYLYQAGPVKLPKIAREADDIITARSEKGMVRYEFAPDAVTVTATNATSEQMIYYLVFDAAINVFLDNEGRATKTFATMDGQKTTTWFGGKSRLAVSVADGQAELFGPWQELQGWKTELAAYETRTIKLQPGRAAAEELAKLADARPGPIPAGLEPGDIAAPKLGVNGKILPAFERAHEDDLTRGKAGQIGLLFIGDSITNRWREPEVKDIWQRFEKYHPANFGIEGDKTQHVLWRFEHGELDGITPQVAVVLIGTNNMGYPAEDIIKADTKIVAEIHRRLPGVKVLLLGILPRATDSDDPARPKIKFINVALAKLADGEKTQFLDFGGSLLDADGTLSKEMAPDGVHLTRKGYEIWANAMQDVLDRIMP